MTTNTAICKTV